MVEEDSQHGQDSQHDGNAHVRRRSTSDGGGEHDSLPAQSMPQQLSPVNSAEISPRDHESSQRSASHEVTPGSSSTIPAGKVRFSTDIQNVSPAGSDADGDGKPKSRPSVALKIQPAPILGGKVLQSPTGISPTSPTSAQAGPSSVHGRMVSRTRDRGYSLRRTLFNKNIRPESGDETPEIELESPAASHVEPKAHVQQQSTGEKLPLASGTGSGNLSDGVLPTQPAGKGIIQLPIRSQKKPWLQHQLDRTGIPAGLEAMRKKISERIRRAQEIPPSENGRHIDLDVSAPKPLIDERTKQPYIANTIRSSRYTPFTFLPRQLLAQFSKLANFYFLCISILQLIPGLSTTGTYTTIVPLMFFVALSMAKEGYDDLRRARLDKEENNREARVLRPDKIAVGSGTAAATDLGDNKEDSYWSKSKWHDLKVGDVVKLTRDDAAPADLVLLHAKDEHNIAYVETMALDGETNLKSKQALRIVSSRCRTASETASCKAQLVVEDPNIDLYNFEGKISAGEETLPLTNNEVIYRGSILRNTPEAVGVVIYSGEECKIRMNANKSPRTKAPALQAAVNQVVVLIVILVLALSVFLTIANQIWEGKEEGKGWYLTGASIPFGQILVGFIIMFNTMIPLSLYVSLEIVKVLQILLLNDIDMYDEASDTPMEPRTSTINEELGQVSYIFSDKTGTLTNNSMKFRKMSVAGTAWLHDRDLREEARNSPGRDLLIHKKRNGKGKRAISRKSTVSATTAISGKQIERKSEGPATTHHSVPHYKPSVKRAATSFGGRTDEMIEYIVNRPQTVFARRARFFLLALALCHACMPEQDDDDDVSFQSASPDEVALVTAARDLGYLVIDRQAHAITIRIGLEGSNEEPKYETFEILNIIEFSSVRKRMSIVVRMPDRRICVFCKGADSTITRLLRLNDLAASKVAEIERRASEKKSMEIDQVMRRRSEAWSRKASIARSSMSLGRTSTGIPPPGRQTSVGGSRKASMREAVDLWLKERENDVDIANPRESSQYYSPRPSQQFGSPRASGQFSARSSLSRVDGSPSSQGDDTEELVEEALVVNDSLVFERCFQHINDFATEGLRTLLYAHRYVTEDEYAVWNKIYSDSTTSLTDRQAKIEKAAEIIETQFELTGGTAIEDKLQKGVPEAIEKLRRAKIKLWMLTGDKRETAINIGHSCRLIKDYSEVIILDHELGALEERISNAILAVQTTGVAHSVIVIDGATLAVIETEAVVFDLFIELAVLANSVICCRASPSQKATLVKSIRLRVKQSVTLAIGDGANDIAMIQEAHVGIGITGKEGLQAARVSDYSIAQFRFLLKLLLVHGRWNYNRVCKYTLGTFWKEMLFYLTQALYQRSTGYTGTSLYEPWSLTTFNTLFTSLCVIFMGTFEKDLSASTLLAVPELYSSLGQIHSGFNIRKYLFWASMGVAEAVIIYYIMYGIYARSPFTFPFSSGGQDIYAIGTLTYTAAIIMINTKMQVLEVHNKTTTALAAFVISVGGWFLWCILLSVTYSNNEIYKVRDGLIFGFGRSLLWWLVLILVVSACILLELAVTAIRVNFMPTDVDVFQALEKDLEIKKRFEEASADELRMGWDRGTKRSSLEILREQEAEAERERERERQVEEILANRRDHMEMREKNKVSPELTTLQSYQFQPRHSIPISIIDNDNTTTITSSKEDTKSKEKEEEEAAAAASPPVPPAPPVLQPQPQKTNPLDISELFSKGFGAVRK